MGAPKGNKYAAGNKGGGNKPIYQPGFAEEAHRLALLGATDEEMALSFGVSEQTINNWKKKYKEFAFALKEGKFDADGKVAKSLYDKALSGDTTACIFWLKNRHKLTWRDKQDHEHTGPNGGPMENKITVEFVDADSAAE